MYLGTTPTITLRITTDFNMDNIKQVWFTIASINNKLTKTINDVKIDSDDKTISVTLTQEETLSFSSGMIKVQARILTKNDEAFATPIKESKFEKILKGGVISE